MRGWALAAALLCASCSRTVYEAHFAPPAQLGKLTEAASRAPFIKCHMPDGRVFVLQDWSIEEGSGMVEGLALAYDADRNRVGNPQHVRLLLSDVALIETDRPYSIDVGTGPVVGMAIGTTISAAFTIGCLASLGKSPCWK